MTPSNFISRGSGAKLVLYCARIVNPRDQVQAGQSWYVAHGL